MYNTNHWTESRLFKYIEAQLGVPQLQIGTDSEWEAHANILATEHPYLTSLYDKIDAFQDFVETPFRALNKLRYYVRYRYIKQTHIAPTYLPPGHWYEPDQRLIHSAFGILVDFIEIDKARMQHICEANSFKASSSWYHVPRSKEKGLEYLNWEIDAAGEQSAYASSAQNQLDLYTWWVDERPLRVDPYESTGYNDYCAQQDWVTWGRDETVTQMLKQIQQITDVYEAEDNEMLTKLINIRHTLRT